MGEEGGEGKAGCGHEIRWHLCEYEGKVMFLSVGVLELVCSCAGALLGSLPHIITTTNTDTETSKNDGTYAASY